VSDEELIQAYAEGRISRRFFIRRLVAAGVSFGAAMSYAQLLGPAAAAQPIQQKAFSPKAGHGGDGGPGGDGGTGGGGGGGPDAGPGTPGPSGTPGTSGNRRKKKAAQPAKAAKRRPRRP
jgi:hypothetical protein